jgi:hypothetical protein
MTSKFLLDGIVELRNLTLEFCTHGARFVREPLVETLDSRVDHSHLATEQKVSNLIDSFGRRWRSSAVSLSGLLRCISRHCSPRVRVGFNILPARALGHQPRLHCGGRQDR